MTLDNTYCSGEVSKDGWNWSTATRVTEMEQKTIQLDYTYVTRPPSMTLTEPIAILTSAFRPWPRA